MKNRLVGIILILMMTISFNVIAFADTVVVTPASAPICFDVDIQE